MRSAIEACSHSLAPIVRGPERLPIQICLEVSASVPPVRRKNGGPGDSADGFSLGVLSGNSFLERESTRVFPAV